VTTERSSAPLSLLRPMQGSSADTVKIALLTRLKPASQEGLAPVAPAWCARSDHRIVRGDMAIYIATNHDPVPDPPCPVCKGGGVDWKVRKDGQFDRRFKYSAHP
jgi:hypothetical protein